MNPGAPLVVADTNVMSHMFRQDALGVRHLELLEDVDVVISFQTSAELLYGARYANWGPVRLAELRSHMNPYRVIWPDGELVEVHARLRAECRQAGLALDPADAWIAATAIHLESSLATIDRDFRRVPGLNVLELPAG